MRGTKKSYSTIRSFFADVVLRPAYYIPVLFLSFVGFGFSVISRTYSIDDPARHLYFGDHYGKIAGLRWGQHLIVRIFANIEYTPFVEEFIGLVFLIIGAIILTSVLYYLNDQKQDSIIAYSIYSCIFITFPLINEIWEYYELCVFIGYGYVITSLCLLYKTVNEKLKIVEYLLLGLLLSTVAAGVEAVYISYITFTLIILYVKRIKDKRFNWFLDGVEYAIPFVIAFFFRNAIGYGLIYMYNIERSLNGTSGVYWSTLGFNEGLSRVINNFWYYLNEAQIYFPITEFVIAIIVFFGINLFYFPKKGLSPLIIAILIIVSLFSISFIQGVILPQRVAHIMSVFVAFVSYYAIILFEKSKYNKLRIAVTIFLFFVAYRQSVCLHTLLALNNQRSDNEARIVNSIGQKLYSQFNLEKPVVFCGYYDLGENINRQTQNITETNVQSMLNWAMIAFENQDMMKEVFSYYGYDIDVLEDPFATKDIYDYTEEAILSDMKPFEIKEFDDYYLVYFGNFKD